MISFVHSVDRRFFPYVSFRVLHSFLLAIDARLWTVACAAVFESMDWVGYCRSSEKGNSHKKMKLHNYVDLESNIRRFWK